MKRLKPTMCQAVFRLTFGTESSLHCLDTESSDKKHTGSTFAKTQCSVICQGSALASQIHASAHSQWITLRFYCLRFTILTTQDKVMLILNNAFQSCNILPCNITSHCAVFLHLMSIQTHRSVTQLNLLDCISSSHWYLRQHASLLHLFNAGLFSL